MCSDLRDNSVNDTGHHDERKERGEKKGLGSPSLSPLRGDDDLATRDC